MSITFADSLSSENLANNGTVSYGHSVAAGDLIVIFSWNQSGTGQALAWSDNVNTGNYVNLTPGSDGTRQLFTSYKVCNASGTPTMTLSLTAGIVALAIVHYKGFSGTATATGDFTNVLHTGSSSTAVAGTSFNTSQSNELVCVFVGDLDGATWGTAPASPWNARTANSTVGNPGAQAWDQIFATSGSAAQITGTLATADYWFVTQVGFRDDVAASGSNAQSALLLGFL